MALDFIKLYDGQSVEEACEGMNTNLDLINKTLSKLSESGAVPTIYNNAWSEDITNLEDGTVQISVSDNLIKIGKVENNAWVIICETELSGGSGEVNLDSDSNYIAYPLTQVDETLEGKPFGYAFGKIALAGTTVTDEDSGEEVIVHAVGWYVNSKKVVYGRLALNEPKTAGAVVYVLNGDGGWTTETPEQVTGNLIQPIGAISDDGNYIDISICEGWGTV